MKKHKIYKKEKSKLGGRKCISMCTEREIRNMNEYIRIDVCTKKLTACRSGRNIR